MRATVFTIKLDPDSGEPDLGQPEDYEPSEVKPLPAHFWDTRKVWRPKGDPNGAWVEDVDGERAKLWAAVKADRDSLLTVNVPGIGVVDADLAARIEIDSAVVDALSTGLLFTRKWKMADNSLKTLSAAQMKSVKIAVDAAWQAKRDAAEAKRAKLDLADTVTKLLAAIL